MSSPAKLLSAFLTLGVLLAAVSHHAVAQLTPASTGGVVELDRLLQRLAEPRRVLIIGAHPDDEDTSLLAWLSRGLGVDAAYLSLSRGEGGQNLIGPELGQSLGLLRTRELLAAREIDGAQQFFSRGYDFGYTRSLDETFAHWPADSLLKDVVRIVRRFRPHVIVSTFSGTSRDGHGQHQAAGVTARAAFEIAGDPGRFPELRDDEGLTAWTPLKLYRSTRFDRDAANVRVPTGELDPRSGRSFHQIAMASRSQHRSQDMGVLQDIGPRETLMRLLEDRTAEGTNGDSALLAGIPRTQSRHARTADSIRTHLRASDPQVVAPALASLVAGMEPGAERNLAERALGVAAGVVVDATIDRERLVRGESAQIELRMYNAGSQDVRWNETALTTPSHWIVDAYQPTDLLVLPGSLVVREITIRVPDNANISQPYFLETARTGSMYSWQSTPAAVRGTGFQPPLLRARIGLNVHGQSIEIAREVSYRYRDQAIGEIRREARVVPRVGVAITPDHLVWPAGGATGREFTVTLTYSGDEMYAGTVSLDRGDDAPGWSTSPSQDFSFSRRGETLQFTFTVRPPPDATDELVLLRAIARGEDERSYANDVVLVEYPHVRTVGYVRPAQAVVRLAPIVLPTVARVGYVRGAADRVPETLQRIGLPVDVLTGADLAGRDLSVYDVVVVGSRAYESDAALTENNDRLLEYSRRGGHLVVQYQQYAYFRGGYAPFSLDIGRPHDRVTDETAEVRVLELDHRFLKAPNRISSADWDGWPQERGLYFANSWDDSYRPLLEMNDPGGPALRGSLLVASFGEGTYVYTGLSFFRALPAGNPGAFKLFLNLLSPDTVDVP